jgi:RNA polymerase sigma factor (sigma-70 family)
MQEVELIELCKKNDQKAMQVVYDQYVPKMRGVCFRYARTVFEVDDILQEAFVRVFLKIASYKFQGSFEGWIRRIVINTAINYFKSNSNTFKQTQLDEISDELIAKVEIVDNQTVEYLYDLINKLPAGYKFIFNMYAIDGYSHKEIAEMLKITESTSRSQYTRAKKQLILMLEKKPHLYENVR